MTEPALNDYSEFGDLLRHIDDSPAEWLEAVIEHCQLRLEATHTIDQLLEEVKK